MLLIMSAVGEFERALQLEPHRDESGVRAVGLDEGAMPWQRSV